ncbi:DUF4035 domain-containing protein [Luteimonas sp. XNQY3]|nr:DUF4035 domain-containing protein [Luteimonas sp. XNQY3]MCD9005232.1 DUF4035 domain-containing protein [Luteimonas sp. XNQY3]
MDPSELAVWIARSRESPIGMDREDFHAAQVVSAVSGGTIANALPNWGRASSDDPDAPINELMGGD